MDDVTRILLAVENGDPKAAEQLLPLVYDELRKLAAQRLNQEKPGQTLQATALVHEAYLRLVNVEDPGWNGRGHFFAAAAEAMRRILVENARRKKSLKGGGGRKRVALSDIESVAVQGGHIELIALHEALTRLEAKDKRKAELIKLRFFAGLTNAQAAEALGISVATAEKDWVYAKTWLRVAMRDASDDDPTPERDEENLGGE